MNTPGTVTLRFPIPADMADLSLDELKARAPGRTGLIVLGVHRDGDTLMVTVPTVQPFHGGAV